MSGGGDGDEQDCGQGDGEVGKGNRLDRHGVEL